MWKSITTLACAIGMAGPAIAHKDHGKHQVEPQVGWMDLFDGRSLDGWYRLGGAHDFRLVDGAIVGKAVAEEPNGFLVSKARFSDFILEATFKVDGTLNSGLIFRGDSQKSYRDGRLFGYQAEIDPTSRRWAGGIHEEARRGWLYPLNRNPACMAAFNDGDWNDYRVEAIGNDIRTFVNGQPCARLIDDGLREGFVALQVHNIAKSGAMGAVGDSIAWRKVRILTQGLEAARLPFDESVPEISNLQNQLSEWEQRNGYTLLFDGESPDAWTSARGESFPERGWIVENGNLVVEASDGAEARNGGDIITRQEYSDFELQLDFKLTEGANSGIKYFVDPDLLQGEGSAIGLEFQILDDANHPDAKMGVAGNRTLASLYDLISAANLSQPSRKKRVNPIGQWNHARIVVKGNRVEHWLNNMKAVEYERGTQMFRALVAYSKYAKWPNFGEWETGPILLQDHGDRVEFRNIKIRDLSGAE